MSSELIIQQAILSTDHPLLEGLDSSIVPITGGEMMDDSSLPRCPEMIDEPLRYSAS